MTHDEETRGDVVGGMRSRLPLYRTAVDWDALFREYPVPDVFVETVYRWPRDRVRALQNARFLTTLAHGWRNPFYQRLWRAAGVRPEDVRGLDDIARLPLFTSDDIRLNQEQHPPFGDIQGVSLADLATTPLKVQTSGGTTGKPRPTLFGPVEWEIAGLTVARTLYVHGARPGDVLQIPATASLANLAWGAYKACHNFLGVLPVTSGSGVVMPSRRQLEIAFEWGTNAWVGMPEYIGHLARVAREELGRDVRDLRTKFITTFLGPDLDGSLRRELEQLWGCPVYDQFGAHELGSGAFECQERAGLHLMEDCVLFEVVDVDTGTPVPAGQAGNLVATVFYRRIPPIIRYNLRDLGRIVAEDTCRCGSSFRRIDHFLGRSDDMVKLRGVNVYPMACLPAVRSDARTTGEWLCVVDRVDRGGAFRDEMTVRVETRRDAGDAQGLVEHLERRLHADLGVKVAVELVPEGSLAEAAGVTREGKARRLSDRRFARS